ncbi:MAG: hypothetical protein Rubg2KO_37620 [Rubricoccaceae bacterium]
MRTLCLLAMVVVPVLAQAQPLAFDAAPVASQTSALHVALVMQQADGSSCDGGGVDCSDSDCSPSGSDCASGGDGGAGCLISGGCLVLAGGVGYGIYRLIQGRRPRPDSLASLTLTPGVQALANALAESAHVTLGRTAPASADVVLTIQEEVMARSGVGASIASRQLVVEASDRAGNPIALSTGSLPSASLSLPVDASLAYRARALLNGLAMSGR